MQAQAVNGQLYIITSEGELYMYNPLTDNWCEKASFPIKDVPLQTFAVDEKLFAITKNALYMYNTVKDEWVNKTSMAVSMSYAFSVMIDNKIIIGDYVSSNNSWKTPFRDQIRIRIYDTDTDRWSEGKTNTETVFCSSTVYAGATKGVYAHKKVYVFGLEAIENDIVDVKPFTWVYDPVEDTWSTAKAGGISSSVTVVNDILYMVEDRMQYVPIGYSTIYQASSIDTQPQNALEQSIILKIIGLLVLTVGMVITGAYYFKKRKETRRSSDESLRFVA